MFKNLEELKSYVEGNNIEMLDFKITELNGRWRHLTVPAARLSKEIFESGFGFDGSNYGYATIEASDMIFIPDLGTAFLDPFWERPTLSFLGNIYEITDEGKKLFNQDARTILSRAVNKLKNTGIADQFIIGPEFEFHIFDEIYFQNKANNSGYYINSRQAEWNNDNAGFKISGDDGYHKDAPHDLNRNIRSEISLAIENIGIDVKYHHHEVGGPGQHEIEVKMADALTLGDGSMKIKYLIKNIAHKHGKIATFMPKPMYGEAGNGFHVHMQLFKNGKSIFAGPEDNYAGLSDIALNFMGGVLKHTPALMALNAPSTNSYKRLVRGFEAPVVICFASSNRSAVIRIPGYATAPEKRRFEFRPGDASGNPYLNFASLLMAGLDGIEKKLDPIAMGMGPYDKNMYELSPNEAAKLTFLPQNLNESLDALKNDHNFLLKDNVFTKELAFNWIDMKKEESKIINNYPHPKEFDYYLDI